MRNNILKLCLGFVIVLFTVFGCTRSDLPISYQSVGKMELRKPGLVGNRELYNKGVANLRVAMESQDVQKRAHEHLDTTHPELVAKNPTILQYAVTYSPEILIFDLIVESDNPEYSQLFLQACMDEYIKWRREVHARTVDTTLVAIEADISGRKSEIKKKEDEIKNFLAGNKKDLSKSKQAELARITSKLERLTERQTHTLANYEAVLNSQSLTKNYDLVSISQAASPAVKL